MSDSAPSSDSQRMVFLQTLDLTESELTRSIQALESAGIRIEAIVRDSRIAAPNGSSVRGRHVVQADRASASDYSAVAVPESPGHAVPAETNTSAARFLEAMRAAGKLILYQQVPPKPAGPDRGTTLRFGLRRLWADSWARWNAIDAPRLGAALAYYTLLSLAPLLVLIVSVAGVFFRRTLVQSGLVWQARNIMGDVGTSIVRPVLESTKSTTGIIAGILSILTLLVGASGVFLELRDSLDMVWEVRPPYATGLWSLVRERLFAFLMVLGTGLLLSVSILLSAMLATPVRFVLHFVPTSGVLSAGLPVCVSLVIMTLIFALIYKIVPDIDVGWGDVWIGALVTSILFTAGKSLIGLYLSKASIGSPYAAAGSLIVFLTWVYYSMQIFLFGAEFTHEYALQHGSYSRAAHPGGRSRPLPQTPNT